MMRESSDQFKFLMGGFAPRCLSIDLEVGLRDGRIHAFAALRGDDSSRCLVFEGGDLQPALAALDALAEDASFILGHNIVRFDLPHLAAANPRLRLLSLPAVDTLWLNPLAFPRNPYHHLVKHYQDGQLLHERRNDPLCDAQLALEVFSNQQTALAAADPDLVLAWHWLTTQQAAGPGLDRFFMSLRRAGRPTDAEALASVRHRLADRCCRTHTEAILAKATEHGWALAYALAWLSVSGSNSVMPPWVRHQFPQAATLVRLLRDTACGAPECVWCRERHDAIHELKKWFGFPSFRPEPAAEDGTPLQQRIVEAAMRGEHCLGILPTGTGKSLCYQIPALSRFDKTGALTVVISPLVALMEDQVDGLRRKFDIQSCAALNGLLSLPERADVLDRLRLGDIGILIVSPEQLRSKTFRKALAQREVGAWVLDEAHCLSKWGQDFRPDYRYIGRFIREKAGSGPIPPVQCLTATAKPEVVADILAHFKDRLGIELRCFNGGAERSNLDFSVVPTTPAEKFAHIHQLLESELTPNATDGAIVYCATRKQTEEIAAYLNQKGWAAGHFHARLVPETKKSTQRSFIDGRLRVIAATNAFGMGIDKPDVRLVIHADIPGSLENYLQEAGRAGRDRLSARCVLLYTPEDVERQFGMSAHSRLSRRDIQTILTALRRLHGKKRRSAGSDELIATAGEILAEDEDGRFERDGATEDTRVRTAISWLEEAALLTREENSVQVFPSSLRVTSLDDARQRLERTGVAPDYRQRLLALVGALIAAPGDDGISTDELMGVAGLSSDQLRGALFDLERYGLCSNDTALTAYLHVGVERSSRKRLEAVAALESALLAAMRELHPDFGKGQLAVLHLRHINQRLRDEGHIDSLPENLRRILQGIAADGRDEAGGIGSLKLRRIDAESISVELQREWSALDGIARRRRAAAERLLEHLIACLPPTAKGSDQLAETTLGKLLGALEADWLLKAETKAMPKLLDRALLWMHEQEVIRLNKGLAVFRPAMTLRLDSDWKRRFTQADFVPLKGHYDEQVFQVHVMAEYVQRGLETMKEALRLTMDYFTQPREEFLRRWLPGKEKDLARQTTPRSWQAIVEALGNPAQQRIVADNGDSANVLVLAGPGSGKTRVLVHRIAYLIRVRRERSDGILALAYNRHAATQIRERLKALIGNDAYGVTVLTLHALSMRLVGASFADSPAEDGEDVFRRIIEQASALLRGDNLPPEDADRQRERLLAGFRWILIDEYQDITAEQYGLVSALAGRTRSDEDGKINLLAVGDDDQNIYAFNGASVEFIRRFTVDYAAQPAYLVENYRSTANIVEAANLMIAPAAERMKAKHPIRVDGRRHKQPAGGAWSNLDPVAQGRVQIISAGDSAASQAVAVLAELERLAGRDPHWQWTHCAVIARHWKDLRPLRTLCELHGIPVQLADEGRFSLWSLRETQTLIDRLLGSHGPLIAAPAIAECLSGRPENRWWQTLRQAIEEYRLEAGEEELPRTHFLDWLAEWGRDIRRRQTGLLLLTAHGAKGQEFDHVAILDGRWVSGGNEDKDAARRLYYVAMTRARQTLTLMQATHGTPLLTTLPASPAILRRPPSAPIAIPTELDRQYWRASGKDIDLDLAGTLAPAHPIHRAIAALDVDSPLTPKLATGGKLELFTPEGVLVGRTATGFSLPPDMRCIAAKVLAIHVRRPKDVADCYKARLNTRNEHWEFVVPEFIFAPLTSG